jgi:hypothetical protein
MRVRPKAAEIVDDERLEVVASEFDLRAQGEASDATEAMMPIVAGLMLVAPRPGVCIGCDPSGLHSGAER